MFPPFHYISIEITLHQLTKTGTTLLFFVQLANLQKGKKNPCLLSYWVVKTQQQLFSHLPQVKSNHTNAVVFIDLRISCVLRVVSLRVDPLALVGRIVDLSGFPLTLWTGHTDG